MSIAEHSEQPVARLSELDPPPSMRPFEIGGKKGILVRLADGLHAVSALCPHAQAPLHEGALCGTRLVCPWHQSVFNVTSGALLEPPALDGLQRYEVRIAGDQVFVRLPDPPPRGAPTVLKSARTVLVVGAGTAGQVAVETLRQEGFDGKIVLVGQESDSPYDRTNLTKHFLSGKARREDLPLQRDPGFFDQIGVERKIGTVVRLAAREKRVTFADGQTLAYDAAILATGGTPKTLDVPGSDDPRVRRFRTVADAEQVIELVSGQGKRAVAVGASFVGMEAVSSLAQRGVKVTVISPDAIPFERQLGREVGTSIRRLHERNGVRFLADAKVTRFEDSPDGLRVRLEDGRQIIADAVVVGVGVRPATDFVDGIERADDGGIVVDSALHAGHDLYAVGDIARFPLASGERVRIEHWRVAQQHAALAARNIARPENHQTVTGTGLVPFFWTYHFEQRMNYVGFADKWEEVILDGEPEAPPFIAYYVRAGHTVAAGGTHRDADLAAMHELLRLNHVPSADQLRTRGYSPVAALAAL